MEISYEVRKVGEENQLWEHQTGEREGEASSRFVGLLDPLQVAKHEVAVREEIAVTRAALVELEKKLASVLDCRAQLDRMMAPAAEIE